jgi:hypothetical protein
MKLIDQGCKSATYCTPTIWCRRWRRSTRAEPGTRAWSST